MTPSYYNELTVRGHSARDVDFVSDFPMVQFKLMAYCKKLEKKKRSLYLYRSSFKTFGEV